MIRRLVLSFTLLCLALSAQAQEGSRPGETRDFAGITFVWCPAGAATLGTDESPAAIAERVGGRAEWYGDEGPAREVTFEAGFWISQTPVTVADWVRIGRGAELTAPAGSGGSDRPIAGVNIGEIRAFIEELGGQARGTFRLPTEQEWEYACRAGSTTLYPHGDDPEGLDDHAWYRANTEGGGLQPVGAKSPNAWGLHDMLGNAWEICGTPYAVTGAHENAPSPANLVLRGGSVTSPAGFVRSTYRVGRNLAEGHPQVTFRIVREAGR